MNLFKLQIKKLMADVGRDSMVIQYLVFLCAMGFGKVTYTSGVPSTMAPAHFSTHGASVRVIRMNGGRKGNNSSRKGARGQKRPECELGGC